MLWRHLILAVSSAEVLPAPLLDDIPSDCVHAEFGSVEAGRPAFAREGRARVVVMGALSRSFPQRALFGHTAGKILDARACDALIVKPARFQCPVGAQPAPAVPRPS